MWITISNIADKFKLQKTTKNNSWLFTKGFSMPIVPKWIHQEIGENMIKHCMTYDINTINIPQYNPSQWGVVQIGF